VGLGQGLDLDVEPGHLPLEPGRLGPRRRQGRRAGLLRGGRSRPGREHGGERGQAEHDPADRGTQAKSFHASVVDPRGPHLDRRVGLSLRSDDKERDVSDQHPTVPTWTPEPPPPPAGRRRFVPGLVAALIAVVVLFGGVGLFAARQTAATAQGADSPEAAATGLLTALGSQDLDRAARFLDDEEALLLRTYGDRATALLAGRMTGPTGKPMSGFELTARDLRFQRVAGLGGADVGVVELAGGTVGGRDARGAKLELPAAELNRRLSDRSKGAIKALRVVTVRSGDRWRVSLLASAAEYGRLAAGAGEPDWDQLAGTGQQAAPGAASPEAAVTGLVDAAGQGQQAVLERLSPAEQGVLAAYGPLLQRQGATPPMGTVRVEGLKTPDRAARRRRGQGRGHRRPGGRAHAPAVGPARPGGRQGPGALAGDDPARRDVVSIPGVHSHRLDAQPSRTGAPVTQILLVADDPGFRDRLRLALERLELTGEEVSFLEAVNGNDALVLAESHLPDLVVADVSVTPYGASA
jgi:CheY-like chemotaxis protein